MKRGDKRGLEHMYLTFPKVSQDLEIEGSNQGHDNQRYQST